MRIPVLTNPSHKNTSFLAFKVRIEPQTHEDSTNASYLAGADFCASRAACVVALAAIFELTTSGNRHRLAAKLIERVAASIVEALCQLGFKPFVVLGIRAGVLRFA